MPNEHVHDDVDSPRTSVAADRHEDAVLEPPESAPELRQYVQQKQAVAQAIRVLREFLKRRNSQARYDACHELLVKLAEDRLTLAVVGQFKRGKSSLMNAIVGRELLPTGLLPLTSVVTILRFGPRDRMLVPCERLPYEEEFPISSLHAYVTEEGNPGNRRQIKAVYVEVSSPFLRRGLEFVDTPGIGSAIEANTETTYRFLPQCDAVLFVTSIDSPLTGAEILFLRDLRRYVRKVFFVVNKSDLLEEAERSQVLEFVRNSLRREMATNEIRMFPVSARAGLAAKLTNNQQGIDAAGISDLEAELAAFLAAERATTLLVAIVDQAARLIDAECRDINHKPASNPVPLSSINHPMTDAEQAARIAGLRSRLELLRTSVLSGVVPEVTIENPPPDDSASASVAATPPSVERDAAALATRGCPVCDYVAQSLFDFFRHFQYSLATEESAQKLFAEELGFCPFHTWHLGTLSSTLGISAGYPRLIERLATELSALALEPAESAARVTRLLARPQTCRACHFVREVEARYVHRMADLLAGSTYREQFARSEGVCLRHLAMLLQVSPGQETLRFLLKDAARHCQEVAEDMHSYVIKREATRRALLNQDEQDAHVRALTHLVGHRYLASLDLPDMEF